MTPHANGGGFSQAGGNTAVSPASKTALDEFYRDTLRFGCLRGFRYFSLYLRGREELFVTMRLPRPDGSRSGGGCGSPAGNAPGRSYGGGPLSPGHDPSLPLGCADDVSSRGAPGPLGPRRPGLTPGPAVLGVFFCFPPPWDIISRFTGSLTQPGHFPLTGPLFDLLPPPPPPPAQLLPHFFFFFLRSSPT